MGLAREGRWLRFFFKRRGERGAYYRVGGLLDAIMWNDAAEAWSLLFSNAQMRSGGRFPAMIGVDEIANNDAFGEKISTSDLRENEPMGASEQSDIRRVLQAAIERQFAVGLLNRGATALAGVGFPAAIASISLREGEPATPHLRLFDSLKESARPAAAEREMGSGKFIPIVDLRIDGIFPFRPAPVPPEQQGQLARLYAAKRDGQILTVVGWDAEQYGIEAVVGRIFDIYASPKTGRITVLVQSALPTATGKGFMRRFGLTEIDRISVSAARAEHWRRN
jgi:hypothetical protein